MGLRPSLEMLVDATDTDLAAAAALAHAGPASHPRAAGVCEHSSQQKWEIACIQGPAMGAQHADASSAPVVQVFRAARLVMDSTRAADGASASATSQVRVAEVFLCVYDLVQLFAGREGVPVDMTGAFVNSLNQSASRQAPRMPNTVADFDAAAFGRARQAFNEGYAGFGLRAVAEAPAAQHFVSLAGAVQLARWLAGRRGELGARLSVPGELGEEGFNWVASAPSLSGAGAKHVQLPSHHP